MSSTKLQVVSKLEWFVPARNASFVTDTMSLMSDSEAASAGRIFTTMILLSANLIDPPLFYRRVTYTTTNACEQSCQ